ncbi:hypothetical protein ACEWY4_022040 [Coilia grayii]|uniref:Sialomucin core protein 24 n=1 Tax=Coilia grayii TaxID=363190 RepID=A0ABD1J4W0_9TELE
MNWRLFHLTLLLAIFAGATYAQYDDCASIVMCDLCHSNTTECSWVECEGVGKCLNASEQNTTNCINTTCGATAVPSTSLPTTGPTTPHNSTFNSSTVEPTSANTTTPQPPTTTTHPSNATVPTSPSNVTVPTVSPSPSSKSATFDAASFVGGIVLVLGLQAVIFFLYKFCKSKDRNYHTL